VLTGRTTTISGIVLVVVLVLERGVALDFSSNSI
jgi:hypothetical protein